MSGIVVQFPQSCTTQRGLNGLRGKPRKAESLADRTERKELHRVLDLILNDRNHAHPTVRSNVQFAIEVLHGVPERSCSGVYQANKDLPAEWKGGAVMSEKELDRMPIIESPDVTVTQ